MGMDVSGKAPTSEVGEYFHANVWWWHPLADYIEQNYPCYYDMNPHWHTNDGGGLNAMDSKALGEAIQKDIDEGRALVWICARDTALSELPSEVCDLCNGTGHRTDGVIPPRSAVQQVRGQRQRPALCHVVQVRHREPSGLRQLPEGVRRV